MTERERMKRFYLTNYDFQIYCNKNMQRYDRSLDAEMASPITREYYLSLQKGGYNAKRTDRGEDTRGNAQAGAKAAATV